MSSSVGEVVDYARRADDWFFPLNFGMLRFSANKTVGLLE